MVFELNVITRNWFVKIAKTWRLKNPKLIMKANYNIGILSLRCLQPCQLKPGVLRICFPDNDGEKQANPHRGRFEIKLLL
jgi:hypothetical protein